MSGMAPLLDFFVNFCYTSSMKIEFGLMSIISLAYLVVFGFIGDVEMHSIDVSFSLTRDTFDVTIDPVWAIWVPGDSISYCNAFAFGNVMVLNNATRGDLYGEYLLVHESNHVEQFQALGWLTYPSRLVLDIEPSRSITQDWNDPTQPGKIMWGKPYWWQNQWSFISLCSIDYVR